MKRNVLQMGMLAIVLAFGLIAMGCPQLPNSEDTFTVTFDSNGGSDVAAKTVSSGGTITLPTEPTKSGTTFGGWFTDTAFTNAFTASTPVTGNITV
jgi:hypothetical protein